jgi:hypothetical protein
MSDTSDQVAGVRSKVDGVIFIDANQYLDLYRMGTGRKLLAPLKEQEKFIFLTGIVAEEIQRRKVEVAASFLQTEFSKLTLPKFSIPDHLFGTTDKSIQQRLEAIHRDVQGTSKALVELAHALLGRISRSEDEVSKALEGILSKAEQHTADELQRARDRREMGKAPGKKTDPLGDQLSWEQILTRCRGLNRLWIITRDGDYATAYAKKLFLNAALYQEVVKVQPKIEVFCFDNITDGIRHFADAVHVNAETLPGPEEAKEIKEEQDALPPLGWLTSWNDAVLQTYASRRRFMAPLAQFLQVPNVLSGSEGNPRSEHGEKAESGAEISDTTLPKRLI